uniref:RNA-directed RNA polymerase C-terminal domain-containing protein n=1 Tax=Trichuris muris TaxID=70415 RepID=A0A5S6QW27_TRIMR
MGAIDASKFDHNVPLWLIEEILVAIKDHALGWTSDVVDSKLAYLIDTYVEVYDTALRVEKGLLSGWRMTTFIGSLVSELVAARCKELASREDLQHVKNLVADFWQMNSLIATLLLASALRSALGSMPPEDLALNGTYNVRSDVWEDQLDRPDLRVRYPFDVYVSGFYGNIPVRFAVNLRLNYTITSFMRKKYYDAGPLFREWLRYITVREPPLPFKGHT